MSKRDWARKKVEKRGWLESIDSDVPAGRIDSDDAIALLRAERSRARRIVRAFRKGFNRETIGENFIVAACDEILKRLG